jgi:hypothetical protein
MLRSAGAGNVACTVSLALALSGHMMTPDLSPLCAPKQTSVNSKLWVHALLDRRAKPANGTGKKALSGAQPDLKHTKEKGEIAR